MKFKKYLLRMWNFWPPFFGAGIKVKVLDNEWRDLIAELKLRPWTSNYVGTQFGGSMFAMTDAFYMVMLIRNLGRGYVVWDKSASIRFLKPGRTHLRARFTLSEKDLLDIKSELNQKEKILWYRTVQIIDDKDVVVAEVDKEIYIRRSKEL